MEEAYNFINNNNIKLNPNNLSNSFSLEKLKKNEVLEVYKKIKLIRESELKIALERKNGTIGGPVHLSIGQEAIQRFALQLQKVKKKELVSMQIS